MRRQYYDQYQNSMQDMRFHLLQKTDGVRKENLSLLPRAAATVNFCAPIIAKQGKGRGFRGRPRDYQPGLQNRPTLLNLSGVPFPAFRGLHPHQ